MSRRIQMPWTKRANTERERADDARLRLEEVEADSERVHGHVDRIHREVRINGFLAGVLELNRGKGASSA